MTPEVGSGEGGVYADLTATLWAIEVFLIDPQPKKSILKTKEQRE